MAEEADKRASETVNKLRESFNSGKTRSREWRVEQLNAFLTMLREGREQLQKALYEDLHKNPAESFFTEINLVEHEVVHMLDHIDEYMAPEKTSTDVLNFPGWSYVYKDPLGVCLIIGAWNYPVNLTLLPIVGCIAAGNCALIKVPSKHYSASVSRTMANLGAKYLDNDCIQFVEGDRNETQSLLKQRYDLIFFTGGHFVGQMVAQAAAKNLTPTVLELGGKSPCIVDKSADLDVAARRVCWATFVNSGQTCLRPDYLLVHEDVAEPFFKKMEQVVKQYFTKDPQKSEFFGRIINPRAHKRLEELVSTCEPAGKIRFGGTSDASDKYIAPTVVDYGTDEEAFSSSALMADEIFGPILPSLRYTSDDQLIQFIVSREKPLGLYCFTTNSAFRNRILSETSSGVCNINDCMMNMSNEALPFGGVGKSGMGSYHGQASFMTFSHRKSVLMKTNFADLPLRYPPYSPKTVQVLSFVLKARPRWHYTLMKIGAATVFCVALVSRLTAGRAVPIGSRL
mmetsp:Transcript_25508/g.35334  ORF Transcript_25508/g.35334 Transcript_25508/m.35334 type:complete len:512 (+) Transcript_25508:653-2188(+)|eukprot:CAMPEP_0201480098 /NCGR_PEP_ID=MMETSP0151_2-20130828/4662_1 /ASSEMBLY_ACC=CAM_ASM_000257 /TAXON_ID=200890 /ORGANISM="Paramoeba atlantica, Strain 621/1 / CCAP 1560/9" /LENGTH=511 /DNA_ID=CAMNT_0047861855 /DNA_START=114 /DNA_END=1649 /DNA_ORIENTATION=-